MKVAWLLVAAIACGLSVGLGIGWMATADRRTAPPLAASHLQEPADGPPDIPAIAPPAAHTPAGAAIPAPDVAGELDAREGQDAADAGDPDAALLVPAAFDGDAAPTFDPHLLPRGPGRFAVIDLSTTELALVPVRAGKLDRDGAAPPHLFQKATKLAVIRAPGERVELLHLGYDREATPVLAHVRTAAGIEGVIALVQGDVRVPLLPDPEVAEVALDPTPAGLVQP
jgi:hypothetical protein